MITGLLVVVGGLLAAAGHPWGLTPIVASILCAGCFLRRRDVVLVGLGAMLLRDVVAGLDAFTLVRLVAISGVVGVVLMLRPRPRPVSLGTGLLLAAPVYHVILAAGDWATHYCTPYPRTFAGLRATLASAWPYMQRSFLNDLMFTAAFIGLYVLAGALVRLRWPRLIASLRS